MRKCTTMAYVLLKRAAVAQRNADHGLLGRRGRLADRFRHFAGLAVAEARTTLAVANHDKRSEAAKAYISWSALIWWSQAAAADPLGSRLR